MAVSTIGVNDGVLVQIKRSKALKLANAIIDALDPID